MEVKLAVAVCCSVLQYVAVHTQAGCCTMYKRDWPYCFIIKNQIKLVTMFQGGPGRKSVRHLL